jgi:hypothetical protein
MHTNTLVPWDFLYIMVAQCKLFEHQIMVDLAEWGSLQPKASPSPTPHPLVRHGACYTPFADSMRFASLLGMGYPMGFSLSPSMPHCPLSP